MVHHSAFLHCMADNVKKKLEKITPSVPHRPDKWQLGGNLLLVAETLVKRLYGPEL